MIMHRTLLALLAASIVVGAAGCGGSSQDEGPPTDALGSAAQKALQEYQQGGTENPTESPTESPQEQ